MGCYRQFLHIELGMNNKQGARKRAPELEQGGWENLGACWSIWEHIWSWKLKNQVVRPEE
jgi:hypothetical protein